MKNVIKFVVFTLGAMLLYFVISVYLWNPTFGGKCGMSSGPIYGESIIIEEDVKLDQQIEIPNGKLGFMNLSDSLSPKLIKFDKGNNLIWAVEFKEDSLVGLPHNSLSEMELVIDEFGIKLVFFNNSVAEPGRIFLTNDYELEYMCLSPM